ncbi:MAG: hypothetical protein WC455_17750 [Dehalococcoidia bacterium]|jgi:hypothetical protein
MNADAWTVVIIGFVVFCFGYFVAAVMAEAKRGADMEWERRYNALVETIGQRTDQAKGGKA